jgi:hypothetical protein
VLPVGHRAELDADRAGPLRELDGIVSGDLVLADRGRERRRAAGTADPAGGGMAGWRLSRRFQAQ